MEVDKDTIKRAWESEDYRRSLPSDVQDAIPDAPEVDEGPELSDEDLRDASGDADVLNPG